MSDGMMWFVAWFLPLWIVGGLLMAAVEGLVDRWEKRRGRRR